MSVLRFKGDAQDVRVGNDVIIVVRSPRHNGHFLRWVDTQRLLERGDTGVRQGRVGFKVRPIERGGQWGVHRIESVVVSQYLRVCSG